MADADLKRADALEAQYDPEMNFRPVQPGVKRLVTFLLIVLGLYHFYTAGFGIPREQWHKGIHLGAVLLLIFLTFAAFRGRATDEAVRRSRFGGVPLLDWVLGILALVSALYIPATFSGLDLTGIGIPLVLEEMNFRIGAPAPTDLFFGTILVVVILEATRRAMGLVLPLVVLVFMLFALFGPSIPVAVLQHPGATWPQFLNHIYLTTEGIYGVPVLSLIHI